MNPSLSLLYCYSSYYYYYYYYYCARRIASHILRNRYIAY
jgi:hypothetical protein